MIQVFFRYVLNNALPWPDEVARFLMLWMTGLIAPSAYRWGGFVSIDMLERFLPKIISTLLTLFLLIVSLFVLIIGLELGLKHINAGWIFSSASIKIPFNLIGREIIAEAPAAASDLVACISPLLAIFYLLIGVGEYQDQKVSNFLTHIIIYYAANTKAPVT